MLALSYITYNPCVESFNKKFQSSDPKSVAWPQAIRFLIEKSPVHTARFPTVHVQISQYNRIVIEQNFKMLVYYAVSIHQNFRYVFALGLFASKRYWFVTYQWNLSWLTM
jgi:hypothetical protein